MLAYGIVAESVAQPVRKPVPWFLEDRGRPLLSLIAALACFLVTPMLPNEMRLILCFDVAAIVYVGLFVWLMNVATQQDCIRLSTRSRWRNFHLLLLILLTLVGILVIPSMAHPGNGSELMHLLHYCAALLAIALGWLIAHISFGLHYMHMYYNDTIPNDGARFDEGMAYPEQKLPDYWDFMYYSFTIAMCYQTSDVTITNPKVRRVTLLHAIYSFFFVCTILGLVINILSNVI